MKLPVDLEQKKQVVMAHTLHSQLMMADAPIYVLSAMRRWLEELTKKRKESQEVDGFTEAVAVGDSATMKLD